MRCSNDSGNDSCGVDDSDSVSSSDLGNFNVDADGVDDLCALNVTVCDSLNAVCLWLCSLCGLVMGADGSGLVSVIRAPNTSLTIHGIIFGFSFFRF